MSALESVPNNKCFLAEHSFRSFGTRPLLHFYEYQVLVPMFPDVFFFSNKPCSFEHDHRWLVRLKMYAVNLLIEVKNAYACREGVFALSL